MGPSGSTTAWRPQRRMPKASTSGPTILCRPSRTRFIILFLADPHTLESGQRCKNGSSNPHRIFTFWRSHNLDLDRSRSQGSHFLRHAFTDSREHSGSSRKNNIGIQILSDINITLHDGLESAVSNTVHFETGQVGLEQYLGASETFIS